MGFLWQAELQEEERDFFLSKLVCIATFLGNCNGFFLGRVYYFFL
jgi:hypothetical protein